MSNFESNNQAIAKLESIDTNEIPPPPSIDTELYNLVGKQANLVNREGEGNVSLQTGKIVIKFHQPAWIYDISLELTEEDEAKSEKLKRHTSIYVSYARGGNKEIPTGAYSKRLYCPIKDFISEIEIKFHDINKLTVLIPPSCKKISLTGFDADSYYEFCEKVSSYIYNSKKLSETKTKITNELNETNLKIQESSTQLQTLTEAVANKQTELTAEEEKLSAAELELSKTEAKISVLNGKSSELEQRISESTRSNENLARSIQDNRQELQTLLANKNVFMEEFTSYVEQGKSNISGYIALGAIMLIAAGACLWRLISSAVALSNDPAILKTVSAFDLFLSRAPLAIVLGMVIIICMKMVSNLLSKTFEIHQERLLLAKLSILAKDNSFYSVDGLEIADELVYATRISLKMELLKEFLAGNYKGAAQKEIETRRKFIEFRERFSRKDEAKTDLPEEEDPSEQKLTS